MKKTILTCFLFIIAFSVPALGQTETDTLTMLSTGKKQLFDAQVATQTYLNRLTPEQKEKSDAYFEGGYWILLWEFILEIATAWIFLYLGLSKWIMRIASKTKRINIRNLIYILMYLFFALLIAFPFSVYTGFFREHQYNLSNMSFPEWLSDEMISMAIFMIFGGMLLTMLYMVIRKVTKYWWILGSGITIIFMIFSLFISPVFISPLFNDYKPLEEGKVKDDILSLARANGVPVKDVYQFNASKQSTYISANVSGFGSTIRISLNDNLLKKCSPAEIKSAMAHELGHYVLNHVYKLLIYFSIVIIIGFALINLLMQKVIKQFGQRWGISSISAINSLPLFVLFFSFYMFIATPLTNTIIRTTESEADIFGLNAAQEPDGFASVSMKLSEYRKINPGPLEEIIFFDHPSGKDRVLMSMKWKAEHLDQNKDTP
jgi:STE24 endopeptidase